MHDVLDELSRLHAPVLFIHGTGDLRVRIEETRQLFLAANDPKSMEEVIDADHWFRGDEFRNQLVELVVEWVQRWAG
jgi:dipeptidyl aminopeptidase/acylaminoacyl peptidase